MTTWVKSLDDSFDPINDYAAAYAAGYRGWFRYVGPGSAGKHWTRHEMDSWFAQGPDTFCGFLAEAVGDEPLTSPSLGDDHGRSARAAMDALGVPAAVLCSPAMDRNVTKAQTLGSIATYMRNWIRGFGGLPVPYIEVENGGRLVDLGASAGTFVPAAYSWNESGRLVTPANAPAHVVQTQEHNGVKAFGGTIDAGHCRTDAPHIMWNPAGQHGSAPTTGDEDMAIAQTDLDAISSDVVGTKLGSTGPTVGVALQDTWNNVKELETTVAALVQQVTALTAAVAAIPTTALPAGPLSDADKDDIANRVLDGFAARQAS